MRDLLTTGSLTSWVRYRYISLVIALSLVFAMGCPPPKDYPIEFYQGSKKTKSFRLPLGAADANLRISGRLSLANLAVLRIDLSTEGDADSLVDFDRTRLRVSISTSEVGETSQEVVDLRANFARRDDSNSGTGKHAYECAFPISVVMRYSNSNRIDSLRVRLEFDSLVFGQNRAVHIDSIYGVVFP